MNWTPPPETHRVDATTNSSGRIQDEPATVQQQDSIFQMPTEAELDEFREDRLHINDIFLSLGLEPPIQPQDVPLPRPSTGPLTLAELDALLSGRIDLKDIFLSLDATTDSSGRIQDEPVTVQPQDSIFQMPTEAELDEFPEDRLHINDIFLSLGLEPPIQPQDVPLPRPSTGPLTLAELDALLSGRIDLKDIFLSLDATTDSSRRIQDEPATVQPQDSIFQMPSPQHHDTPHPLTEAELDEPIFLQPQDVPPPEEPEPLPRPLTDAELDEFTDSNAILLSQGLEPLAFLLPPEERETLPRPRTLPRSLTEAELDEFTDSSGIIDINAIFVSQGLEPLAFMPPAKEPQSKGLSKETISKYLKTMIADEIRAHSEDGDRRNCAVCLDDVCRQKDIVAILDDCGHEFHYCCLEKWLRRKNICPLCRRTAIFR